MQPLSLQGQLDLTQQNELMGDQVAGHFIVDEFILDF